MRDCCNIGEGGVNRVARNFGMNNKVDAEHIREKLISGELVCLDSSVAQLASRHLTETFPFAPFGTIVDWGRVPSKMLRWMTVSDEDTVVWASDTKAGKCTYGLLLYSPSEPCLLGPFNYMLSNLDELVWGAPGCRVLFGVEQSQEIVFTDGIIEFNGRGELFASIEG